MAPFVKVLAARPEDLSSSKPQIHMTERGSQLPKAVFQPSPMCFDFGSSSYQDCQLNVSVFSIDLEAGVFSCSINRSCVLRNGRLTDSTRGWYPSSGKSPEHLMNSKMLS